MPISSPSMPRLPPRPAADLRERNARARTEAAPDGRNLDPHVAVEIAAPGGGPSCSPARLGRTLFDGATVTAREAGFILALGRTLSYEALARDVEPQVRKALSRITLVDLLLRSPSLDPIQAIEPSAIARLAKEQVRRKLKVGILRKAPSGAMLSSGALLTLGLIIPDGKIGFLSATGALLGVGLALTPYWLVTNGRRLEKELDACFARPAVSELIALKHRQLIAMGAPHGGDLREAIRASAVERALRYVQASALFTRVGGITRYSLALLSGIALFATSVFSLASGLVHVLLKRRDRRKMLRDPAMVLAAALVGSIEKRPYFMFGRTAFQTFVKARKAELRTILGLSNDAHTKAIVATLGRPENQALDRALRAECHRVQLIENIETFARDEGTTLDTVRDNQEALLALIERYAVRVGSQSAKSQTLAEGVIASLKSGVLVASAAFFAGPAAPFVAAAGGAVFLIGTLLSLLGASREHARFETVLSRAVERAHAAELRITPDDPPADDEAAGSILAVEARSVLRVMAMAMEEILRAPLDLRPFRSGTSPASGSHSSAEPTSANIST